MLDYYKYKEVSELFLKGKTRKARQLLQELQTEYVALCDELSTLKLQVKEFDDILHFSENLVFDGSYYWLKTGSVRHGPFCADCCKDEGVLVRLPHGNTQKICWRCGKQYSAQIPPSLPTKEKKSGKVIPLHRFSGSAEPLPKAQNDQAIHD